MENNKEILIYDIKSLPDPSIGLTPEQIIDIYNKERIVLWDSSDNGIKPEVVLLDENLPEPFIVDIGSTQLSDDTMKRINNVIKKEDLDKKDFIKE